MSQQTLPFLNTSMTPGAVVDDVTVRVLIARWRSDVETHWGSAGVAGPINEAMNPRRWSEWRNLAHQLIVIDKMSLAQAAEHIRIIVCACAAKGDYAPPPPPFFATPQAWRIRYEKAREQVQTMLEKEQAANVPAIDQEHELRRLRQTAYLGRQFWSNMNPLEPSDQATLWHGLLIDPGCAKLALRASFQAGSISPLFVGVSRSWREAFGYDQSQRAHAAAVYIQFPRLWQAASALFGAEVELSTT